MKQDKRYCTEYYLNFRNLNTCMSIKSQLKQILFNAKTNLNHGFKFHEKKSSIKVKLCFLSGYFQQIAYLKRGGTYTVLGENHQVLIHPSSSVKPTHDFVLYLEFVLTSKNFIRQVSTIRGKWFMEMFPTVFDSSKMKNKDSKKILEKLEQLVSSRK